MENVIVRDATGRALRRLVVDSIWPTGIYVCAPEAAAAVISGECSAILFPPYDVFFDSPFTPHDEVSWRELTPYRPPLLR